MVRTYQYPKKIAISSIEIDPSHHNLVQQSDWYSNKDNKFVLDNAALKLIDRLRHTHGKLRDVSKIKRGVLFDMELLQNHKVDDKHFLYFEGNVYRYKTEEILKRWVEYGNKMKEYPRTFDWFEGERILLRRLVNRQQRLMASYTNKTFITDKNLYAVKSTSDSLSVLSILGLLNSRIVSYMYLKQITQATKDDFPQITIRDLQSIPFPAFDKKSHARMVELVESMLALQQDYAAAEHTLDDRRHTLAEQIKRTDAQIDALVYELYGLTDDEIRIVEGG